LSKETYNVLTELKAVLEGNSWDDAAKFVTSLHPESAAGVAPYLSDRALLTSLTAALQLALEDYPQTRQALGEKYGTLAKLRIAQAASAGNAQAIALASVQFAGTEAAADAHRWLGDQALVAGFFSRATAHYERAMASGSSSAGELMPRLRLAAAMLGRDAGRPAEEEVHFGDISLSAAEFESLVAEMRSREATAETSAATTEPISVPRPGRYEAQFRSRLDGAVGERPQEETGRRTNQFRVDWVDRQLAVAVHENVMYTANRFQVAAYDSSSGQRLWQSQAPPGSMQRAQEWALIPMRPLVVGNRIFVRLLYSPNPVLVCLDKSSGKLQWVSENREREFLVSDPLWKHGQLVALGILQEQDQAQLRHYNIDPRTGQILRHRELVNLRSTWQARSCCELVEVERGLVAVLGGVTIALDEAADVRWIRRHTTLPADEDPRWVLQWYRPPYVRDGRIYLAQPGVRTVDCLDAATGRMFWSANLPEVVGLVGLTGDVLIVRTETEVLGLALADGTLRWQYDSGRAFSFSLVDEQHLLMATREAVPGKTDLSHVKLTWLATSDGKPVATSVLADLNDSDPRLGPLIPCKDSLYTFFGRGQHDPTRDVVKLVPIGDPESLTETANAWLKLAESSSRKP
jgi:outer membrane protein assembly factor BamB